MRAGEHGTDSKSKQKSKHTNICVCASALEWKQLSTAWKTCDGHRCWARIQTTNVSWSTRWVSLLVEYRTEQNILTSTSYSLNTTDWLDQIKSSQRKWDFSEYEGEMISCNRRGGFTTAPASAINDVVVSCLVIRNFCSVLCGSGGWTYMSSGKTMASGLLMSHDGFINLRIGKRLTKDKIGKDE